MSEKPSPAKVETKVEDDKSDLVSTVYIHLLKTKHNFCVYFML